MSVVEVKTAELFGPALDWAVAKVEGITYDAHYLRMTLFNPEGTEYKSISNFRPSADWGHGGPLIQKYGVLLSPPRSMMHVNGGPNAGWQEVGRWGSTIFGKNRKYRRACFDHETEPLVAAMRAIVQFELGDTIEIPAELLP